MHNSRRKSFYILAGLLPLTIFTVIIFIVINRTQNDKKQVSVTEEKPKSSSGGTVNSSSGGTYSSSSGGTVNSSSGGTYSSSSNGTANPSSNGTANPSSNGTCTGNGRTPTALDDCGKIDGSAFGASIRNYLEGKDGTDKIKKEGRKVDLEPVLRYIMNRDYVNPYPDGSCGYMSLFAVLYCYIEDENHPISKIFYNPDGYDNIEGLPKLQGNRPISDLFNRLKNNKKPNVDVFEYSQNNKEDILLALRYILLKHIWDTNRAWIDIADEKVGSNCPVVVPLKNLNEEVKIHHMKKEYVTYFLDHKNFYNRDLWMTTAEMTIYCYIFNVNIWTIVFNNITSKNVPNRYVFKQESSTNLYLDTGKYEGIKFYEKNAKEPPETLYIFSISNNHFMGVL
ncbi:hypothetical protein PAEPH01_0697 [Pancytospora epiphaga]|nr:hypothetical protein PAEPH01_0697 [Pancytospora epiphaga]